VIKVSGGKRKRPADGKVRQALFSCCRYQQGWTLDPATTFGFVYLTFFMPSLLFLLKVAYPIALY
jgi:hypothetical protein